MKTFICSFSLIITIVLIISSCGKKSVSLTSEKMEQTKIIKTKEDWKKILTPEQFHITRESGTERAFTGEYWNFFEPGEYACVCCGAVLFNSNSKFKSSCGWPSFSDIVSNDNILFIEDKSFGMVRIEVRCAKCDAHLGHVFEDGPAPTGLRYCINSSAIKFINSK